MFNKIKSKPWWLKPLTSSLIASGLDTFIFFSIAFSTSFSFIDPSNDVSWANQIFPLLGYGLNTPYWVSLAFADFCVKLNLAIAALIPFRIIINKVKLKSEYTN